MAQRYEYQDIDGHVILLFVHPALMDGMGIKEYRAASQRPYTIL